MFPTLFPQARRTLTLVEELRPATFRMWPWHKSWKYFFWTHALYGPNGKYLFNKPPKQTPIPLAMTIIQLNWICLHGFQQPLAFIDKLPQPSLLSHQHPTATVRTLLTTVNCLVWSICIENQIVQIRTTVFSTPCNVNPSFHDIKMWIKITNQRSQFVLVSPK